MSPLKKCSIWLLQGILYRNKTDYQKLTVYSLEEYLACVTDINMYITKSFSARVTFSLVFLPLMNRADLVFSTSWGACFSRALFTRWFLGLLGEGNGARRHVRMQLQIRIP